MRKRHAVLLAAVAVLSTLGCRDDGPTGLAGTPRDGRVFIDQNIANDFQAFAGSVLDAVQLDNTVKFRGTSSLRVTIPAPGAGYAGGAFVAGAPRDLSGYNALTFYARASVNATLNVAGLGNDNTGNSKFTAERIDIPVTTTWQKFVIPIPNASRLTAEQGLFYFAEGPEGAASYNLWLDDIQFESIDSLTNPRPVITTYSLTQEVGATTQLGNIPVTFAVGTTDVLVSAMSGYFTFASTVPAVATVNNTGLMTVAGAGSTVLTATLGAVTATGQINVASVSPPATAAPTPTYAAGDVISLFSGPYTNVTVGTWSPDWDMADVSDRTIAGNATKRYTNLTYAVIDFSANQINATAMTHFRMDFWTPDNSAPPQAFLVKLVDFGANGVYQGGDDVEHEIAINSTSTPALATGSWITLDIPLTQFTNLTTRANLAQIVIVGAEGVNTVYIDNVLLHR